MITETQMKIFGIGNDTAPVSRFAKLVDENESVFLKRMFADGEIASLEKILAKRRRVEAMAASFAVKESVLKALGTGLAEGMSWRDIAVEDIWGKCSLTTSGKVQTAFQQFNISDWHISCSSTSKLAIAYAILFTEDLHHD